MKKLFLSVIFFCLLCSPASAGGWDFYFFGVNANTFKQANYWQVVAGALASVAVHTAGHYIYAGLFNMDTRQEGFSECDHGTYEPRKKRESAQAGLVLQNIGGLILTSIPFTRQTDFTRGYVAAAFAETAFYPVLFRKGGDLNISDDNGGNDGWEYAGNLTVATHNVLRINWKKEAAL